MKILSVLLLVLLMAGCATKIPEPLTYQVTDGLETMEPIELEYDVVPDSPYAYRLEVDGQVYGGFKREGLDTLLHLRQVARTNTALLEHMVAANNDLIKERSELIAMLKETEKTINTLLQELHDSEVTAAQQSSIHRLERLVYQIGLVALGVVAL